MSPFSFLSLQFLNKMHQCNQYFSLQFLIIMSFISASTFAAILFHTMPNPYCHGQSSRRYLVGLTGKDSRNNAKNCRGFILMSENIFESQICEAKRNVDETFRNIPMRNRKDDWIFEIAIVPSKTKFIRSKGYFLWNATCFVLNRFFQIFDVFLL